MYDFRLKFKLTRIKYYSRKRVNNKNNLFMSLMKGEKTNDN